MNKKIKIFICVLLLFIILGIQISYAISNKTEKSNFFTVSKTEISPEETLEISFNIKSLEDEKFKIILKSSIDSKKIYTKDNTNIAIDEKTNDISIEVDKSKMNLDEIKLYYPISKEIQVGTKIQLIAQVTSLEDEIKHNDLEESNETEIKPENNQTEGKQEKDEVIKEEKIEITIVEKTNENKEDNIKTNEENNNKPENNSKQPNTEIKNNSNNEQNNKTEKTITNLKTNNNFSNQKINVSINTNNSMSKQNTIPENQAVYNGSSNNYLSKLVVKGNKLNTNFNKENTTYFMNVENTNKIDITATPESDTAKVSITGNDNISNGENKILISVTAENGNVRYYRIFVNYEEETDET